MWVHIVLITISLKYVFESGSVSSSTFFFFVKIVLALWGLVTALYLEAQGTCRIEKKVQDLRLLDSNGTNLCLNTLVVTESSLLHAAGRLIGEQL